jgi:hypothetical protein
VPSQHAQPPANPDFADVTRFNSHLALFQLLKTIAKANEGATAVCAFCDAKIPYGQSVCSDCMKKYNIRTFDLSNDGCGCDE